MIIPVLIQDPFEDLSRDKDIGRYPRLVLLMITALINLIHFIFAALGSIVGLYWSIPATFTLGAGIFTLLIAVNWITTFNRLFTVSSPWPRIRVLLFTTLSFLIATASGMTVLIHILGGIAMIALLASLGSFIIANIFLFIWLEIKIYRQTQN